MVPTNNNDTYLLITVINKLFTYLGPVLTIKIPTASRTFESFVNKIDTTMSADLVTINELKEVFFP